MGLSINDVTSINVDIGPEPDQRVCGLTTLFSYECNRFWCCNLDAKIISAMEIVSIYK